MAYFAELNSENIVLRVEIVADEHVVPGNDAVGEQWCEDNFSHSEGGVSWKQTFKHGTDRANLRGRYAGAGMTWHTTDIPGFPGTANKFIGSLNPDYYSLYSLDEEYNWVPNLPIPTVDDQGRPLPYDETNLPSDMLYWGYAPENNRYQGGRTIDGVDVDKYYDSETSTWIVQEGQ
jgi:hypothetical protein